MKAQFLVSPLELVIGENCIFEQGTIIGYKPVRKIENQKLFIGDNAYVRSGTIIYAGSRIGSHLETGHNVVIREQNIIGDHFSIWSNSVVDYGCTIGNYVAVHNRVYIPQFTTIEDQVFLAPGVTIANDPHPNCPLSRKCMHGPIIRKGAQIGVGVIILPFVEIGERALIGAGSVVTKNIPPYSVAYGNPAKVHGSIFDLKCITGLIDQPYPREDKK